MQNKLVLISSVNNPLRKIFVNRLLKYVDEDNLLLILDEKGMNNEDLRRFEARVGFDSEAAEGCDIKIHTECVASHNNEKTREIIEAFNACYVVNAGTPRKLKDSIVNAARIATLNIHPGKLPYYRGCTAVEWALHFGDVPTNTLHVMDCDYDSGDILAEEGYHINSFSSYSELRRHMYYRGPEIVGNFIAKISSLAEFQKTRVKQNVEKAIYRQPISDENLQLLIKDFGKKHAAN